MKWTASRSEAFITDAQGRDHTTKIELALDKDGMFLAFRTETYANLGAYLRLFSTVTPTYLHGPAAGGPYRTPLAYVNVKAVFTNTVPVDAYRGAGRPEGSYQLERVVDQAARELGIDPAELRRRNFVKPEEFPYQTPLAVVYDSGNYHATLDKLLEISDHAGLAERRAEAKARGRLRGFGFSTWVECCGLAPSQLIGALGARAGLYEAATVRVNPTGGITVFTGTHAHGQGHETAFAQIVADRLGIDESLIEVVHGDTARVPFGMGTYGSRSGAVGGAAILKATDKVIEKAKKFAAHLMEAAEADLELKDGRFTVAGTDKSLGWVDVTLAAYVPHNYPASALEPGLEETAFYDPTNFVYPAGAYGCEVEVDPETGAVEVKGFWAADDFGVVINPLIVAGQQHGGVAQGIGQALLEHAVYDDDGQLVSGSLMDYAMPRADDLPGSPSTTPASPPAPTTRSAPRAAAKPAPSAPRRGGERGPRRAERRRDQGELDRHAGSPARVWAAIQAAE